MTIVNIPVALSREEQNLILKNPDRQTPTGLRDVLIMNLFLNYGLRLYELLELKWTDLNLGHKTIYLKTSRGSLSRELILRSFDARLLSQWKQCQIKKVGSRHYVFTTLSGHKLSSSHVERRLSRQAKRSGISKRISPHTLRHIFAVDSYKKLGDLEKVRQLLGLKYLRTTEKYLQTIEARLSPGRLRWLKL